MTKSSWLFCCVYKGKGYFYVLGVLVTCCVINWGFCMRYLCAGCMSSVIVAVRCEMIVGAC